MGHKPSRICVTFGISLLTSEGRKREIASQFKMKKNEKTRLLKFRVTPLEQEIINLKKEKAGLSMSEFLRRLALDLQIKNHLTDEEIECYKTLSKFSDNFRRISNLFKLGDVTGMKKETLDTSRMIRGHLEKFQK